MNGRRTHELKNRLALAVGALRCRQWIHFALLPAAAFERASLASPGAILPRALLSISAASCALAYAYGINAVGDRKGDEAKKKNPLTGMTRLPLEVYALVFLAALLALGLGISLGAFSFSLMLISIAAGTVYSAGPRMKSKPLLGLIFNTLIFVPLLGLALSPQKQPPGYATVALTFTVLLVQNQLLHERADEGEDARAQNLTTARFLGERGTLGLVIVSGALGVLFARALAPNAALFGAAALSLAAGTLVSMLVRAPARARVCHKWIALIFGTIVFMVSVFL